MNSDRIPPRGGDMKGAAKWRWAWACPTVSMLLAITTLSRLDPWPLDVILLLVFLAGSVAIAWTLMAMRRPLQYALAPAPVTEGRTLDRIVAFYDLFCRIIGLGARVRRRTIDKAGLVPGHVLDAGCGSGDLTRLAATVVGRGGLAVGINAAPDMIRVANEQAANARSGAPFKLAAVEALPFGDTHFGVTFAKPLLHHLPADCTRRSLRELFRLLRTGSRLIVVDLDRSASRNWKLLKRPFGRDPAIAAHLAGGTPDLLLRAGFAPTQSLGEWGGALGIRGVFKPWRDAHYG